MFYLKANQEVDNLNVCLASQFLLYHDKHVDFSLCKSMKSMKKSWSENGCNGFYLNVLPESTSEKRKKE